jgi:membrane-associated protease RseP (regulator of RpoE activity)
MDGLLIALIILIAYLVLVFVLKTKGILEKYNMTNWGPFIMWRTKRGRDLIDTLAKPRRFWLVYAAVGKVVVVAVMVFITALLIWEAFLVPSIPASSAPSPEMLIGLPGLNPVIPLWYGILGLVIAVFIHEFAHGILTRVGEMKVKALGIVFLVVPMGAFVEPDEEALGKVEKKKRTSVYAVGPGTNVLFALLCAFLFSMVVVSSAQVAHEGPVVLSIAGSSPSSIAGIQTGDQIVEANGAPVASNGFNNISAPDPGTNTTLVYYRSGNSMQASMVSGMYVTSTSEGDPASNAGIQSGMIIATLDGHLIRNYVEFRSALENVTPGATVPITVLTMNTTSGLYENDTAIQSISTLKRGTDSAPIAYLGVFISYSGIGWGDPQAILNTMAHPYANMNGPGDFVTDTLRYIALPFLGLQPLSGPLTGILVPGGMFAWMSADMFWILANSLYWIFWINLMVGMTNALPAVPLDGGFLFKDWLDSIVGKVRKGADQATRERYVNTITWGFALLVLFLILWQIIGPRVL